MECQKLGCVAWKFTLIFSGCTTTADNTPEVKR